MLSARIMGKSGSYGQRKMKRLIQKITVPQEAQDRMRQINAVLHEIRKLPSDQNWQVEIKAVKAMRSHAQNDLLWGAIYPQIMEQMGLAGEYEKEELHEFFCGEYFGWNKKQIMTKVKHRPVRTTTKDEEGKTNTLNKIEFAEFLEFIARRCAENGMTVTW